MRLGQRIGVACLLFLMAMAGICGNNFELNRTTTDGGGTLSTGATYRLESTLGQSDAGELAFGDFVLQAGFWFSNQSQLADQLFIDGFE